jgi:hypothetical protein
MTLPNQSLIMITVIGEHVEDCDALQRVVDGRLTSPWDWPFACENDPAGLVMVPCASDCECPARLQINTRLVPNER